MISLIEADSYETLDAGAFVPLHNSEVRIPSIDGGVSYWFHARLVLQSRMKKPKTGYALDIVWELFETVDICEKTCYAKCFL